MDIIITIAGVAALFFLTFGLMFGLLTLAYSAVEAASYRQAMRAKLDDRDPRTRKNALRCLGEKYHWKA